MTMTMTRAMLKVMKKINEPRHRMIPKATPTGVFRSTLRETTEEVIKSLYPNRDQQTAFVKNLDFNVTEGTHHVF